MSSLFNPRGKQRCRREQSLQAALMLEMLMTEAVFFFVISVLSTILWGREIRHQSNGAGTSSVTLRAVLPH